MSILFRCPCGRSMVAESDRAGAVVTCPNCKRSLKVPSGKERGVELAPAPAATLTRTSRLCQRCRKEVSVDSQMCPHCKAILLDGSGGAPPAPAAPAAAPAGGPRRSAAAGLAARAGAGQTILYGGSRATWWSRMSSGGKAGVLSGVGVFVILVAVITYFLYASWQARELADGQSLGQQVATEGRRLEAQGKFQEAYELCNLALLREKHLLDSGLAKDRETVEAVRARFNALQYLVPDPKVLSSVYWRPADQQEFDQATVHLRQTYPTYRQWALAVADAGLVAVQAAKEGKGQPTYEEQVCATMDAFVRLVSQSTVQQRSVFTFQTLLAGLKELANANRNWNSNRDLYLTNAAGYFTVLKERLAKDEPDQLWQWSAR